MLVGEGRWSIWVVVEPRLSSLTSSHRFSIASLVAIAATASTSATAVGAMLEVRCEVQKIDEMEARWRTL